MTRSRRRTSRFGRFVTVVAVLTFIILSLTLYYYINPVDFGGLGSLGMFGLLVPPAFLVVAVVSLLMIFWSIDKKWRVALVAFSGIVLVSCFLSLWPSYALWKWAQEHQVPLNLVEALLPRFNRGDLSRTTTVSYDTLDDGTQLLLDAWPADMAKNRTPRPAIIKIHGGAWVRGSRRSLTLWNTWFNTLGYHVFDVDYRMPPPERWLDETADVKCALNWVKTHASEYNVDTTRLILMGYSAGGNLAMLAAYSYDHPELKPTCGLPVKVKCVINLYGPVDMETLYASTGSEGFVQPRMRQYIGGGPGELVDRYQLLSPINHINKDVPPTISIYGERDRIVPFREGISADNALNLANVPHEVYILPETDHAFDTNWTYLSTQIAREKIRAFLDRYAK
ncbi:MAG TPA: alpha/beta hydrolase [Chryseolinea sp.]|nr:alpha/beta hydrolase [Chryseolinea sp.]